MIDEQSYLISIQYTDHSCEFAISWQGVPMRPCCHVEPCPAECGQSQDSDPRDSGTAVTSTWHPLLPGAHILHRVGSRRHEPFTSATQWHLPLSVLLPCSDVSVRTTGQTSPRNHPGYVFWWTFSICLSLQLHVVGISYFLWWPFPLIWFELRFDKTNLVIFWEDVLTNLVILFLCCRNYPQVSDSQTFSKADTPEVSVAMVTQHGVGGSLPTTGQSSEQFPDSSSWPPGGELQNSTERRRMGVTRSHKDGLKQPLLHHCQGTALNCLFLDLSESSYGIGS